MEFCEQMRHDTTNTVVKAVSGNMVFIVLLAGKASSIFSAGQGTQNVLEGPPNSN
jgi:hypothetical protein